MVMCNGVLDLYQRSCNAVNPQIDIKSRRRHTFGRFVFMGRHYNSWRERVCHPVMYCSQVAALPRLLMAARIEYKEIERGREEVLDGETKSSVRR